MGRHTISKASIKRGFRKHYFEKYENLLEGPAAS
jgi:hypothetical protein